MADNFLQEIQDIEREEEEVHKIEKLQQAFEEVKSTYNQDKRKKVEHVLNHIVSRLKKNEKIVNVVNKYVIKYVQHGKELEAREELYKILGAEMVDTFMALSHTSCIIS